MTNMQYDNQLAKSLNAVLKEHCFTRENGRVASQSTMTTKGESLRTSFNDLHRLGYKLTDARNLTNKHVGALIKHWHESDRKLSTIQSRLSNLRIFAGWIGKGGMVTKISDYLPEVPKDQLIVRKAAVKSKSWTENGVDVIEKIRQADILDPTFGLMIRMQVAFGLRRKEVVELRPWKSDKGEVLAIYHAKGGRPRDINIDTPEQRALLDLVKSKTSKADYMSWKLTKRGKLASLKQNLGRYNKSMLAIGITRKNAEVTGHGLRAQYAENAAIVMNLIPPTLGGKNNQMPREDRDVIREQVSELLGHSRRSITASYYGSFGREATQVEADHAKETINKCIAQLHNIELPVVPLDRKADCAQLIDELDLVGVSAGPRHVHFLWELHSERHATKWLTPGKGNTTAIETAAMRYLKETVVNV